MRNFLFFLIFSYSFCFAQTFTLVNDYESGNEHYILDWNYVKFRSDYESGKLKGLRICDDIDLKDPSLKQVLIENLGDLTRKELHLIFVQGKLVKIGLGFSNYENSEKSIAYFEYFPDKLAQYFVSIPLMKGSCLTTPAQLLQSFGFRHKIISEKPIPKNQYQKKMLEILAKKVDFLMQDKAWDSDTIQYKGHDPAFLPYLAKYTWKLLEAGKLNAYKPDSFKVKFPKEELGNQLKQFSGKTNLEGFPSFDSLALGHSVELACMIKGGNLIEIEPYYLIFRWKDPYEMVPESKFFAVSCADLEKLAFTFKGKSLKTILQERKQIMYPIKINQIPIKTHEESFKIRKALFGNQWDNLSKE